MAGNTQTDTNIPMDARIGAHLRSLADVAGGKSALLTCRVAGLDYPDHIWTGEPVKVTPAQARSALKRFRKALGALRSGSGDPGCTSAGEACWRWEARPRARPAPVAVPPAAETDPRAAPAGPCPEPRPLGFWGDGVD